jgi:hypothetical protein
VQKGQRNRVIPVGFRIGRTRVHPGVHPEEGDDGWGPPVSVTEEGRWAAMAPAGLRLGPLRPQFACTVREVSTGLSSAGPGGKVLFFFSLCFFSYVSKQTNPNTSQINSGKIQKFKISILA